MVKFGNRYSGLKPIMKWTGGKESELQDYILPNIPADISRFIEPFVGGGSVFMGVTAQEYMINDISSQLINLYTVIKNQDKEFYILSKKIDSKWNSIENFISGRKPELLEFISIENDTKRNNKVDRFIDENAGDIKNLVNIILLSEYSDFFLEECRKELKFKIKCSIKFRNESKTFSNGKCNDMFITSFKSAFYKIIREIFNHKQPDMMPAEKAFIFLFMMTYSYGGMSRFNSSGEFNVPYGGISYNSRSIDKLISYYKNPVLIDKFSKTGIHLSDFGNFLKLYDLNEDDFIFLDPPYDTEFNNYMNNSFSLDDQRRLFENLKNQKARWLAIIKKTDFIYNLYSSSDNIRISEFNKSYRVNFKNRNDKQVTHLLISNYDLPVQPHQNILF